VGLDGAVRFLPRSARSVLSEREGTAPAPVLLMGPRTAMITSCCPEPVTAPTASLAPQVPASSDRRPPAGGSAPQGVPPEYAGNLP
jgi:hypothetical protein